MLVSLGSELLEEAIVALIISQKQSIEVRLESLPEKEKRYKFDLVLFSVKGNDVQGRVDELQGFYPEAKLLYLPITSVEDSMARKALQAGVAGVIDESFDTQGFIAAFSDALAGRTVLSKPLAVRLALESASNGAGGVEEELTPREIEVLQQLREGKTNRMIADTLCISEHTVRTHFRVINRKLGAKNRVHSAVLGWQRGII
ncbi:MAG: response regulator transcription factor [Candidatus Woykebacteria bacterium]